MSQYRSPLAAYPLRTGQSAQREAGGSMTRSLRRETKH